MAQGDSTAYYQRSLGRAYFYVDSLQKSIDVFNRLLSIGENTEIVKAGLGYTYQKIPSENNRNLILANSYFSEAIEIGTSDQISDYKIAIADIQIEQKLGKEWNEYKIKKYKEILKVYNRPIVAFKLAQVYKNVIKDHELSVIYLQDYIRMCKTEKKFKYDCRFQKEAMNLLNGIDKTNILRKQFPIIKNDSIAIQKNDSIKINDN
jgi:tetratricopeptide (TPR) repeat protein